jgi:hypothetical protein
MGNEASGAYGELYEVAGGNHIDTAGAGEYAPWVSGVVGLISPTGLVRTEADDRDTWSETARYPLGSVVAHDGSNWTAIEAGLDAWAIGTTYAADALVTQGGENYVSLAADNVGHDPAEPGSDWWALANLNQEPSAESDYWEDSGLRGDCLVIQEGGRGTYRLTASVFFTGDASSVFTWKIFKNGTAIAKTARAVMASESGQHGVSLAGLANLEDDDVIDLRVAGSVGTEVVTILNAYLSIERIFEA